MITRHRFIQTKSLKERLLKEAETLRDQAKMLPFGPVRDTALKKARQAEAAAHMDGWLRQACSRQKVTTLTARINFQRARRDRSSLFAAKRDRTSESSS
jgi:hypothetical protein